MPPTPWTQGMGNGGSTQTRLGRSTVQKQQDEHGNPEAAFCTVCLRTGRARCYTTAALPYVLWALWPHQLWSHLEWVGHCAQQTFTSPRATKLRAAAPAAEMTACPPQKCHGHCPQNSPEAAAFCSFWGFSEQIRKSCHLLSWFFWPKALFSPLTQLSYSPGWVPSSWAIVNNQIHPQREEGERLATSEGIQMIGTGALLSLVTKKGFELQQPCWKEFWIWRNLSHFICLYCYIYIYIYIYL